MTQKEARKIYLANKNTPEVIRAKEARRKEAAEKAKEHIKFIDKRIEWAANLGRKDFIIECKDITGVAKVIIEHYEKQGFKVYTEAFVIQIKWVY